MILIIFLLGLFLILPLFCQRDAWKNYPKNSKKEKIKIGFWNLKFVVTGILEAPTNTNRLMFVSNVAFAKQVPKYTAVQIIKKNPEVYERLYKKLLNNEIKITDSSKIAIEIKKLELEIVKEKYGSKSYAIRKRSRAKSFKSIRGRRI
ncbi:hypothetical protein [Lactococcus lactis]|uniref:Uncharacterized protein n=1 Tax=Lactococcus lactis TaxID=1358 RepID=A0AAW5TLJ9_9LACT|nr:hypothetical protein [Lactococcus lactis]MCW2280222.1 hypothetical protein [Lactococcus lactis]